MLPWRVVYQLIQKIMNISEPNFLHSNHYYTSRTKISNKEKFEIINADRYKYTNIENHLCRKN